MTTRVLFVCLGNICRSPLGEGILRHLVREAGLAEQIEVDSAGTGSWHIGCEPDERSRQVAEANGISLKGQQARKVRYEDFFGFDLILAMDARNLADLRAKCPESQQGKLHLLREFDPEGAGDVPDPYWSGAEGFKLVFEIVNRCCAALLQRLKDGRIG